MTDSYVQATNIEVYLIYEKHICEIKFPFICYSAYTIYIYNLKTLGPLRGHKNSELWDQLNIYCFCPLNFIFDTYMSWI